MRAAARIVAEAGPGGRTRLAVLRGEPPLLPRRTGPYRDGPAVVHLAGGAAGPLGGDELRLDIEVGPGAHLVVRTVAASVVLPGPERSRYDLTATVAGGGRLDWLPEPLVAVAGCRHLSRSTVDLSAGGWLVFREEIVCGRYGEEPGDLTVSTRVRLDGRPLSHQELAVGPAAAGWDSPAVLGGGRATGSLLVVTPEALTPDSTGASTNVDGEVARLRLAGGAVLTTAVAHDARALRELLGTQ